MKGNQEWCHSNKQGENTFFSCSGLLLADCISKLPLTSQLHQFIEPFINSAHVREQTFFCSSLSANIQRRTKYYYFIMLDMCPALWEKAHQLCFFIISEILFFYQLPCVRLKPHGTLLLRSQASWDTSVSNICRKRVSHENRHNCRQINVCQMWNVVTLYCPLYMFCGTCTSTLQIHSHIILAGKSGFWCKRNIFRKKSKVYYKRKANVPTQRASISEYRK